MVKKEILAFIPARGGSKGLPRKNIRLLKNKPLIAYTIEAALNSRYITNVIVSTEDQEICQISEDFGAKVIKRPIELASDVSATIDAFEYTIKELEKMNIFPEISILLQPTSPLRNSQDIDNACDIFFENNCDEVIGVVEPDHSPYWSFNSQEGILTPVFDWDKIHKRRQDLPKTYIPNGSIYIANTRLFIERHSFFTKNLRYYKMPYERGFDIDNEIDFKLCEFFLNEL